MKYINLIYKRISFRKIEVFILMILSQLVKSCIGDYFSSAKEIKEDYEKKIAKINEYHTRRMAKIEKDYEVAKRNTKESLDNWGIIKLHEEGKEIVLSAARPKEKGHTEGYIYQNSEGEEYMVKISRAQATIDNCSEYGVISSALRGNLERKKKIHRNLLTKN